MARDYKRGAKRPANERPPGSWLSFVTGLGIGLFGMLVGYLWLQQPNQKPTTPTEPTALESQPTAPPEEVSTAAPLASEQLSLPKFDFYKILPEIEVKVPEEDLSAIHSSPAPADSPAEAGAAFMLQVASFQNFDDADQSKAQLALQGVQATIQRVVINGQDVWYRVHVGPFPKLADAQRNRALLAQHGVNAIVLKLGGSGN
jgi:cell division protein FtsN